MSRVRIQAKVRTNPDFCAVTAELDRLGLPWEVQPPRGKGHPTMTVEIAGVRHRRHIACTPRQNTPSAAALVSLRRWLRERGVAV